MGKLVVVCHVQHSNGSPTLHWKLKMNFPFFNRSAKAAKKKKKKKTVKVAEDSARSTSQQKKKREEGGCEGKLHAMNLKRNTDMSREKGQTEKNGRGVNKGLRKGGVQSGDVW